MDAQTHILMSASERLYTNSENASGGTRPKLYEFPANNPEYGAWADRVLFIVRVTAVGGSPTTWSLGVKFQIEVPHTDQEQYTNPTWVDLDTVGVTSDIVEGVPWSDTKRSGDTGNQPADGGFGVVATEASSLPVTVKRTITNFGRGVRLKVDPVSSGGTTPYLNATILAVPHTGSTS